MEEKSRKTELDEGDKRRLKETVERHMKALGIEMCCDYRPIFDPPV